MSHEIRETDTPITAAVFEEFITQPGNEKRRFQLINGVIIEMSPTQWHGIIAGVIHGEIYIYLKTHPIGWVMTETSYQLPDDDSNIYIPDVSFIVGRETPIVTKGKVSKMPDLAVEVKSPTNTYKLLREKADYYMQHGTQIVWLIDPDKKQVEVYTPAADPNTLTVKDTLNGGSVLPDFTLCVKDIFPEQP